MNVFRFIQQYFKHPRFVGAMIPSSKELAKQMVAPICFEKATCIIEYGPGTGVFTEEIIKNKHPETILLVIEVNESFYRILKDKYKHMDKVFIVHGSAEDVAHIKEQYAISKVDYIVSGLPFTSLPLMISRNILQQTNKILTKEGKFITFQYSKVKQNFFRTFFGNIQIKKVYWNVPPAFVFTCSF
ncbi:class I SAM-dependent methyltransferase [Bacillus cihuensis]|uniref:class I SAM-dependent methyltransferase n=1 Tax=Bacillus cihuensis TaxID=1208599 RepID=UPI0004145DE7|nr:rRNA adenine N-6-methyltransferase family protein [Bacillus cihuensis]